MNRHYNYLINVRERMGSSLFRLSHLTSSFLLLRRQLLSSRTFECFEVALLPSASSVEAGQLFNHLSLVLHGDLVEHLIHGTTDRRVSLLELREVLAGGDSSRRSCAIDPSTALIKSTLVREHGIEVD